MSSVQNYIWENYRSDCSYYIAEEFAPNCEVQDQFREECREYEVNILFRPGMAKIFAPLLESRAKLREVREEYPLLFDKELENLFLSLIALIDTQSAFDRGFLLRGVVMRRLDDGKYGKKAAEIFGRLSDKDRRFFAECVRDRLLSGCRESFLETAAYTLFGGEDIQCVLYYNSDTNGFILWTQKLRTNDLEDKAELIRLLFLNFGQTLDVVYGEHFGVMGYDSVMRIGGIQLI